MADLDELPIASRETQHQPPTRASPSRDAMDWDGVRVFLQSLARVRCGPRGGL